MLRIKNPLFFLAAFAFLGAQQADTSAVSTAPAQADTAAVAAAPEKELPTVAVLDFEVNGLPADHLVYLFVYDLLGREVIQLVNAPMTAGYHRVTWHAKDAHGQPVSAGIYFYQMRAGSFVRTQKMILLK